MKAVRSATVIPLTLALVVALSGAQQNTPSSRDAPDTLSNSPLVLGTPGQRFRVVPLKGFLHPTALALSLIHI